MDKQTVVRELAEEIRINSKLRHRMGMVEGTPSEGVVDGTDNGIVFHTADGQTFVIGVDEYIGGA